MSDLLKRLKVKKKVVRSTHLKKDKEEEERFKEEFENIVQKGKDIFLTKQGLG